MMMMMTKMPERLPKRNKSFDLTDEGFEKKLGESADSSSPATHLSQSGGTFMEAKLTWVRLNAELKNWRNVGRESLAFLEERRKEWE